MNALKHGLQDIESKTNNEKFLSKDEININSKSDTTDQNYTSENKADSDKTKISNNSKERSDVFKQKMKILFMKKQKNKAKQNLIKMK